MARTDPQFNVRMPTELKEKLARMAESRNRSINAEIVQAIEAAVQLHELTEERKDPGYIDHLGQVITIKDPRIMEENSGFNTDNVMQDILERLKKIEGKIDKKD